MGSAIVLVIIFVIMAGAVYALVSYFEKRSRKKEELDDTWTDFQKEREKKR